MMIPITILRDLLSCSIGICQYFQKEPWVFSYWRSWLVFTQALSRTKVINQLQDLAIKPGCYDVK